MKDLWLLPILIFSFPTIQLFHQARSFNHTGNGIKNGTEINTGYILKDTTPVTSWEVKGCAAKAPKAGTKFSSAGENMDYPDLGMTGEDGITASADSIIYSRFVKHGCCRKATVNIEQQGNVIRFVEYWTGSICKCMCSSTIRAVIKKLLPGEYQVYAIETGTNPFDDTPNNGRDTLMHQKLIINRR